MAENNKVKAVKEIGEETLRKSAEFQRIGNRAVHKAQEENRQLGIPNWYSINGKIISDQELNKKDK